MRMALILAIALPVVFVSATLARADVIWNGNSYSAPSGPFFTIPQSGTIFLRFFSGVAGATTEFGIGTSQQNATPYLTGLPGNPSTKSEVPAGDFSAGSSINFYLKSSFGGNTDWAFSNLYAGDPGSFVTFWDPTHSFS